MKKIVYAAILLLLPMAVFMPVGELDLRFEEPRRGLVALEMLLQHNYIVPKLHGWVYLNKPPLFNWVILAMAWLLGGLSEWAVRLPSLIALFALAGFHWVVARRFVSNWVAGVSALCLLTVGDIFFFETTISGEIDLFYALLVYAQLMCIFLGFHYKNYALLFVGSSLLMAAGVLTKGLPSLLFQGFTLLAWAVYQRQWKWLFSPWQFLGLGLAALALGGYGYAYAQQANLGLFVTKLFMEASEKSGAESRWYDVVLSPITYPLQVFKFLAPWSLLLPFALNKRVRNTLFSNPLLAFSGIAIGVNILPYALTSYPKSRYIYMLYPLLLLVLVQGYFLAKDQMRGYNRFLEGLLLVLMVAVLLALPVLPFVSPTNGIAGLGWWLLPAALVMGFALLGFWRHWCNRLILFALFMVGARLAFNAVSIPLVKKSDSLQLGYHARKMAELANGVPIHYYNIPDTLRPKPLASRWLGWKTPQLLPPFLSYSIPDYISQSSGRIMAYDTSLVAGRVYLAPAALVQSVQKAALHQFTVKNRKIDYVLFRCVAVP